MPLPARSLVMPVPAWPLLLWCGAAAAVAAASLDALLGGHAPSGPLRQLARIGYWAVLVPVLFAAAFELLGRADVLVGALVGAAHAAPAVVGARRGRRTHGRRAGVPWRTTLVRVAHGVVFGFLYVVPGGA